MVQSGNIETSKHLDPQAELRFLIINQYLKTWITSIVDMATENEASTSSTNMYRKIYNNMRSFYIIVRPSLLKKGSYFSVKELDEIFGIIPGSTNYSISKKTNILDNTFATYVDMMLAYSLLIDVLGRELNVFINIDDNIDSIEGDKDAIEVPM